MITLQILSNFTNKSY